MGCLAIENIITAYNDFFAIKQLFHMPFFSSHWNRQVQYDTLNFEETSEKFPRIPYLFPLILWVRKVHPRTMSEMKESEKERKIERVFRPDSFL